MELDGVERVIYYAEGLAERGLNGEALDVLSRGAEEHPSNAKLLVTWGKVLLGIKRFEQARWRANRALGIDETYVPAHLLHGRVLLKLGFPEEAERRFERIINVLDPTEAEAFRGLGETRADLGDNEGAVRMLEQAIERSRDAPSKTVYLLDLAEARREQGLLEEANDVYGRTLDLEEAFPALRLGELYRAYCSPALLALELRSWKEASFYCEKGLRMLSAIGQEKSGTAAALHYVNGAILMGSHQYERAPVALQRAAAIEMGFTVHSQLALAAMQAFQGKYEDAWGRLREIKQGSTGSGEAGSRPDDGQRMAYGSALLWLGELEEAETIFKELIDHRDTSGGDTDADIWVKLMMVRLERRDQSLGEKASHWHWKAYEAYQRAVDLLERQVEPVSDARAVEALGLLHLLMEERELARPLLAEAADRNHAAPAPPAGLGIILVKRGRFPKAIEEFELSLRRNPYDLVVKCHLADARFRAGQSDAAVDAYQEVLRIAPGNVSAHLGLGEILVEQAEGRTDDLLFDEAEHHLTRALTLAKSVGTPHASGSTGLNPRQWAHLYYLRGYVKVKIYEGRTGGRLGRAPGRARKWLEEAGADFAQALDTKVNPHRAKRALEEVQGRLKPAAYVTSHGPLVVAVVSIIILVLAQIAFIGAGGFGGGGSQVGYTTLTLSLVVLLAASFYLPEMLKMKFGGLELEKATTLDSGSDAIDIGRLHLEGNLHDLFEPSIPLFKEPRAKTSQDTFLDQEASPRRDAKAGASRDFEGS